MSSFFRSGILLLICLLWGFSEMYAQPVANFSFDKPLTGCAPYNIKFTNTSTGGGITNYTWELGTDVPAQSGPSLTTASRIFGPGTYDVCLTVTNASGTDKKCVTLIVYASPVAQFDSASVCPGDRVMLTSKSINGSTPINNTAWTVDGFGTVNNPVFNEKMSNPGVYSVTLTVSDPNGCSSSLTYPNGIRVNERPLADFQANKTFGCAPPFPINFSLTGPANPNYKYRWSFLGTGLSSSSATPPVITYTKNGKYDVMLVVEDNKTGCTDTIIKYEYITIGITTTFTANKSSLCEGGNVTFTDTSPTPADSVQWEFGDGRISKESNPTHTYLSAGCYTVVLKRWINGCLSRANTSTCINVRALPTVTASNTNPVGCQVPHFVAFTSITSASNPKFSWDFGDGTPGSSSASPTHTYTAFGSYPVILSVTDQVTGCVNTVNVGQIEIQKIDFTLQQNYFEGCIPLTVGPLKATVSSVAAVTGYEWKVITPSQIYTSTQPSPVFNITDTGIFNIDLKITNALGCFTTQTFTKAISAGQEPFGDFNPSTNQACVKVPITFTPSVSPWVDYIFWDFGDGQTAESGTPGPVIHRYNDTAFYDVRMIIGHNGCTKEIEKLDTVQILEPVAKFKVQQNCTFPLTVQFIDRSVGATVVKYEYWKNTVQLDSNVVDRNPVYTFPSPGDYIVIQKAYNTGTGCVDSIQSIVKVVVPNASFDLDKTIGCLPLSINGTSTSVGAMTYEWRFPGANIANFKSPNTSFVINTPGDYNNLSLIITDINGCKDTATAVSIKVNEIKVDIGTDVTAGCYPLRVNLTDRSIDPFGNINLWEWEIPAGNYIGSKNTQVTLTQPGTYDVVLRVADDLGCTGELILEDYLTVKKPEADFSASVTTTCSKNTIQFINPVQLPGYQFEWNFGDGSPMSTEAAPKHQYSAEGTYSVRLVVRDTEGCTDTLSRLNYIRITNPKADFVSSSSGNVCPPANIGFTNLSTNATQFEWHFGDGGTSVQEAPSYTYNTPGDFSVMLIAGYDAVCKDTVIKTNLISLNGPRGEWQLAIDSTCAPVKVQFTASSQTPCTYAFSFGDGSSETLVHNSSSYVVTHEYTQTGAYYPTLVMTDAAGCSRTFSLNAPVEVLNMQALFAALDTIQCDANKAIKFANFTQTDIDPDIIQWHFEGGFPESSTDPEPSVVFSNPGLYDVTLVVTNRYCSDTLTKPDFIRIGVSPQAAFTVSKTDACANVPITIDDASTVSTGQIAFRIFDYGDGNVDTITTASHTYAYKQGGSYTIKMTAVTDAGCTDAADAISVTMQDAAYVNLSADPTLCIGDVYQINAVVENVPAGSTYAWLPATGLSCADCLNPVISPVADVQYVLRYESPQGCISTDTLNVTVKPFLKPTITVAPAFNACEGGSVVLNVSADDPTGTFTWANDRPGLSCYNCSDPSASPANDQYYVVTVTTDQGCTDTDSTLVKVILKNQDISGPDKYICEGATTQLNLTGMQTAQWSPATGLSCTDCLDPMATLSDTTGYSVQAISVEGCPVMDTLTVYTLNTSQLDAGADREICQGTSALLNGRGFGQVNWSPAATLSASDIYRPNASPTISTTYTMAVTLGECTLSDSVRITVTNKLNIEGFDAILCAGDTIRLKAEGQADTWIWTPTEFLSSVQAPDPLSKPTRSITYQLIGQKQGCIADTTSFQLTVNPLPQTKVLRVYDFFPGQDINIDASPIYPQSDYTWFWKTDLEISCVDCAQPVVKTELNDTLSVVISDEATGCSIEHPIYLRKLKRCPLDLIQAPDAFSPNGDGINDTFKPAVSNSIGAIVSFQVYDRWGSLVFETTDPNAAWDGTYLTGKVPPGVYLWFVEAPCSVTGTNIVKGGNVSLIR